MSGNICLYKPHTHTPMYFEIVKLLRENKALNIFDTLTRTRYASYTSLVLACVLKMYGSILNMHFFLLIVWNFTRQS